MSDVNDRAAKAAFLLRDETFRSVIDEIQELAVAVFTNPAADNTALAQAHEKIRAVHTILDALQARVNAKVIKDKKEGLHRGNDRQVDGGR